MRATLLATTVLDKGAARTGVKQAPPSPVQNWRLTYVRYTAHCSCTSQYEPDTAGSTAAQDKLALQL